MLLSLLGLLSCSWALQEPVYLADLRVRESSGVAVSRRYPDVYWTHNDSGDGPNLYAFDGSGRALGFFTLKGVQALDWEDMAIGEHNGRSFLYVGDIGDNLRLRKEIRVYRLEEPRLSRVSREIGEYVTYRFRYPDGPHDAETLLVTPQGSIEIVTKTVDGKARLYHCDHPKEGSVLSLKYGGEVFLPGTPGSLTAITGGDRSPDGRWVVLRTYERAYLYSAGSGKWWQSRPVEISLPQKPGGEGIAFDAWRRRLVLTHEGVPCAVYFVELPEGKFRGLGESPSGFFVREFVP